MKYRKKPVEVEAFQMTKDVEALAPDWFLEAVDQEKVFIDRSIVDGSVQVYGCSIKTPEGWQKARIGDYIIRGITGELYSCKEYIFCRTYEHLDGKEVRRMKPRGKRSAKNRGK